jgi:hypothetical protein
MMIYEVNYIWFKFLVFLLLIHVYTFLVKNKIEKYFKKFAFVSTVNC